MTKYDEVTPKERILFRRDLLMEVGSEKFLEELEDYKTGFRCMKCHRSYYTCLCNHED